MCGYMLSPVCQIINRYPGPLDAVPSLSKVGSTLSWEPPFSLDLTNIDPDIVYCVDVYNITCGGRDLVSSDCHVTGTNYNITGFSNGYLYEYIVTPRSNVEGAENGTQSRRLTGTFVCVDSIDSMRFAGWLRDSQLEHTYTCNCVSILQSCIQCCGHLCLHEY